MGLWSFAKDAGKKLFGGDDEPSVDDLKKEVADLGLEAKDLDIKVEGDKVRIAGVGRLARPFAKRSFWQLATSRELALLKPTKPMTATQHLCSILWKRATRYGPLLKKRWAMDPNTRLSLRPTNRC